MLSRVVYILSSAFLLRFDEFFILLIMSTDQGILIEAVEYCLYNFRLNEYSNRGKVQKAWENIRG